MLQIDSTSYKSPNHSSRNGHAISMLVLHATVGSSASALSWLCNPQPLHPEKRVSIHYEIDKAGKVYQLVPDSRAAWHAGESSWRGMGAYEIMVSSIGIELENANTGHDPYPQPQLTSLFDLSRSLVVKYSILSDMVVRHLDIAPKRKTDPAGFPWSQYMSALYVPINTLRTYAVRLSVQSAVVRETPSTKAAKVMSVHPGIFLRGKPVTGELVTLPNFGSSDQWLELEHGGYVWLNLLEPISQG